MKEQSVPIKKTSLPNSNCYYLLSISTNHNRKILTYITLYCDSTRLVNNLNASLPLQYYHCMESMIQRLCQILNSLVYWNKESVDMFKTHLISNLSRIYLDKSSSSAGDYYVCQVRCLVRGPWEQYFTLARSAVCGRASNGGLRRFHSQSRRRPLLGPSPSWKCLLALSH